jgi:hypothetical protein
MNGSIVKAACVAALCAGLVGQAPADLPLEGPATISLTQITALPEQEVVSGNTTTWTWKKQITRITNKEIIEWAGDALLVDFSSDAKLMAGNTIDGSFYLFVRDPVLDEDVSLWDVIECYMWGMVDAGSAKNTENPDTRAYSGSESAKGAAEFGIIVREDVPVLGHLMLTGYGTYSYSSSWKGNDESEMEKGGAAGKGTITASYDDEEDHFVVTGSVSFSMKTVPGE